MNTLNNDLETLKKEVWHLNRVVIPSIMSTLSTLTSGTDLVAMKSTLQEHQALLDEIATQLSSCEEATSANAQTISTISSKVIQIESSITSMQEQLSSHSTSITNIEGNVSALQTDVSTLQTDVSTLQTNVSNLQTSLTSTQSDVSTLQTNVSTLQTQMGDVEEDIEFITELNTNQSVSILKINNSISQINEDLGGVTTSIDSQGQSIEDISANITTLQEDNSNLTSEVDALKTTVAILNNTISELQSGGGASQCLASDILYDMDSTDEAINRGYTSGIHTGEEVPIDFTQYRFVRVYCYMMGGAQQHFFSIINRKAVDECVVNLFSTDKVIQFLRVRVSSTLQSFLVNRYVRFIFDTSTNTWTRSVGQSQTTSDDNHWAKFYVYRIEAIR